MSEIALYNTLKKIPGITDTEVKEAISDVASSKQVATKADLEKLRSELLEKIADAKHTMILWFVGVGIVILLAILFK